MESEEMVLFVSFRWLILLQAQDGKKGGMVTTEHREPTKVLSCGYIANQQDKHR